MTAIYVVKFKWSGTPGGAGLSQFAVDAADAGQLPNAVTALRAFFTGCASLLPGAVQIVEDAQVDQYEHTTATLIGGTTITPGAAIAGGQGGTGYDGPSGGLVHWLTNDIQNGHRVRGRTFIVPMANNMFAYGNLAGTTVTALQNAAANVVDYNASAADARIAVWGRPVTAKPATETRPAVKARAASLGYVAGARVPNLSAVLRGRRDA